MSEIGSRKISEIKDAPETKLGEMVVRTQMAVRIGPVDRERTIDLFTRAMGSRSKRKFAEDLNVNVSSVSRISNGQVNEITPQLLAKIAFHAEPDSGVTLDELMEAQGLSDPGDRSRLASRYEEDCRRIIVDELLKKGYSVKYGDGVLAESKNSRMVSDFTLVTDALGGGEKQWMVECKTMSLYSMLPAGSGRTQKWMDTAMAYYYRGGHAGRISLVVDHRAVFEGIRDRLAALAIPDEISVILISTQEGKVLDEYVAPLTDGRIPQKVFGQDEGRGD